MGLGHPDDARALSQYGGMLVHLKQFDEAEQVFKKSISIDPKNTHAQTDLIVDALRKRSE